MTLYYNSIQNITDLFNSFSSFYMKEMRVEFETYQAGGRVITITTPFLDVHNDCIQVEIRVEESTLNGFNYVLRGDISEIDLSKNEDKITLITAAFGIHFGNNGTISTVANENNFGYKLHNLLQALAAISFTCSY